MGTLMFHEISSSYGNEQDIMFLLSDTVWHKMERNLIYKKLITLTRELYKLLNLQKLGGLL